MIEMDLNNIISHPNADNGYSKGEDYVFWPLLEYSGTEDYLGSCFTAKVLKAPMTFQMGQKFEFLIKKQTTTY